MTAGDVPARRAADAHDADGAAAGGVAMATMVSSGANIARLHRGRLRRQPFVAR